MGTAGGQDVAGDRPPGILSNDVDPPREGVELLGHKSYKCCWLAVQDKNVAEDFGVATKLSLPELVIHYKDWRSARSAIFFRERAAQQRLNSKYSNALVVTSAPPGK